MERDAGFMDWVDRVREQATAMAEKAQEVQYLGNSRWNIADRRKRREQLFMQLGELYYEWRDCSVSTIAQQMEDTVQQIESLDYEDDVIDLRDQPARTR